MAEIDEDVMKRTEQLCVKHGLISNRAVLSDVARALMAERKADKWQPIETAPKDGTPMLLIVAGYEPAVGRFLPGRNAWSYLDQEEIEVFEGAGVTFGEWQPTHWMPLPPPPASKGASHDQA